MSKDNPRQHRITLTYARPPVATIEAWSYREGADREFHIAMLDAQGRVVGQARFRARYPKAARREGRE